MAAPVLSYRRTEGRFILDTDTSNVGIGAVLSRNKEASKKSLVILAKSCPNLNETIA